MERVHLIIGNLHNKNEGPQTIDELKARQTHIVNYRGAICNQNVLLLSRTFESCIFVLWLLEVL